jgi:glycosyltransferase involved in cell wall biosynthesis
MINADSANREMIEWPLVSIIVPAYNRAATLERTINSILNQSYRNIEVIIVDDGSTDGTAAILEKFSDPSIRVYRHQTNKGASAAKNSGLQQIKGHWFSILDSDDEIDPKAIEVMMNIPLFLDPSVTAITCNCWDTTAKAFSGKGLSQDQYIDVQTIMTICKGEFWGITKTSLLGNDRFSEKIRGFENILWYKINDKAKRYYLHAPLRIYHTEGTDRLMKAKYNFRSEVILYENLIGEDNFLSTMKFYNPREYFLLCRNGVIVMRASNRKNLALRYYELSKQLGRSSILDLSYKYKMFSVVLKNYKAIKSYIKPYLLNKS